METREQSIGPYRIESRLGGGANAEVYRAHRQGRSEVVALKILRIGSSREERRRFIEEARLSLGLESPRLVRVVEYDLGARRPWIAMDLVPGGELAEILRKRPGHARDSAPSLCTGLLEAVRDLQRVGLNHRDVTPANIILDDQGDPHLVDLGSISRSGAGGAGTLAYLSPEALRGEKRGSFGDIYQVGAVLYEVLSGLVPHEDLGGSYLDYRKAGERPAPLREVVSGASLAVSDLLERMLHPDAAQRPGVEEALQAARKIGAPWYFGPPVPFSRADQTVALPGRARRYRRRISSSPGGRRPDRAPEVRPLSESVVAALGVLVLMGGASWFLGWL